MRIKKYGITLVRLKEKDIELVREKRNLIEITETMLFRDYISSEMQLKWFKSINSIYHNYFLIYFQDKPIGLINGKNIDFEKRTSEGGMFIWEVEYWGTIQPALCSLIMSDFNFLINEFSKNYIQILNSNSKAINHNKLLGYKPTNDILSKDKAQWYVLNRNDYMNTIEKIRKGVGVITKDAYPITLEDIDFKDDSNEELMQLYNPLPSYLKSKINYTLKRDKRPLLNA